MRRLSCTAAVFLALLGVACAVDRSGGGEELFGSNGGSGAAGKGENAGSDASGGGTSSVTTGGTAGVFGVATGNAGGSTGSDNQDHEGGSGGSGGTGTIDPVDSGSGHTEVANEAGNVSEASALADCSAHSGGKTFTSSGATKAHCYWPRSGKSDWQSAVDACMGEGGHLATLGSSAESTFVIKLIDNLADSDRIWLGASDGKTATDESGGGPYSWITGEPFSYAPWAPDNPDGNCTATCAGKRCQCQHRVCMGPDGEFWDRWQDETYYSVCESE